MRPHPAGLWDPTSDSFRTKSLSSVSSWVSSLPASANSPHRAWELPVSVSHEPRFYNKSFFSVSRTHPLGFSGNPNAVAEPGFKPRQPTLVSMWLTASICCEFAKRGRKRGGRERRRKVWGERRGGREGKGRGRGRSLPPTAQHRPQTLRRG